MPKQEELVSPIKCAKCGKVELATYEGNDVLARLDTKPVKLPEGWTQKGEKFFCATHSN
jgi:hypothetical protein